VCEIKERYLSFRLATKDDRFKGLKKEKNKQKHESGSDKGVSSCLYIFFLLFDRN